MTFGQANLLGREVDGEITYVGSEQYIVTWQPNGCFAILADGEQAWVFNTRTQYKAARPAATLPMHVALSLTMPN